MSETNNPTNLLQMTRVTADAECLHSVKPPLGFKDATYLGNAVTCTVNQAGEIKDWIYDSSVFAMWHYFLNHQLVVTYNGLGFDYPLWGGSLWGAQHLKAKNFFEESLKGRTVDLAKDFSESLGRRIKLTDVSVPTLGDAKEMEGGHAPDHWREGRCMEVIEYCRGDIRRPRS